MYSSNAPESDVKVSRECLPNQDLSLSQIIFHYPLCNRCAESHHTLLITDFGYFGHPPILNHVDSLREGGFQLVSNRTRFKEGASSKLLSNPST